MTPKIATQTTQEQEQSRVGFSEFVGLPRDMAVALHKLTEVCQATHAQWTEIKSGAWSAHRAALELEDILMNQRQANPRATTAQPTNKNEL